MAHLTNLVSFGFIVNLHLKLDKSRLLRIIAYLVCCINSVLFFSTTWNYLQLREVRRDEQANLDRIFPPLSEAIVNEHLKQIFADFGRFEEEIFENYIRYTLFRHDDLVGHVYQVREDIVCPVCEDVRYFVGIDLDGAIRGVALVNKFHLYGTKMKSESVDEFLSQFIGKRLNSTFRMNHNVKGITGATKTTQHFLEGILGINNVHSIEAKQ